MSIDIQKPNDTFNFANLVLGEPIPIQNGFYFSRIKYNDDLYIQTPEILSKSGFITNGNRNYIDLIFNNNHEDILEWFENLENRIKILIFEKKDEWFSESNIEMSDIENIFISPLRSIKGGKQFILRSHIGSSTTSIVRPNPVKVYNENEIEISLDEINNTTKFISLLQISGLKFSSRTFQIYIEIKQLMTVNDTKIFDKCLISNCVNDKSNNANENVIETNNIEEPINDIENNIMMKEDVKLKDSENIILSTLTEPIITDETKTETIIEPIITDDTKTETIIEPIITDDSKYVETVTEQHSLPEIRDNNTKNTVNKNNEIVTSNLTDEPKLEEMQNNENLTISSAENDVIKKTTDLEEENENVINNVNEKIHLQNKDYLGINEVDVNMDTLENSNINISHPKNEHVELYKSAVRKAKELRREALQKHLEAQNIKAKYLMNVYSDSDSDYSEYEEEVNAN